MSRLQSLPFAMALVTSAFSLVSCSESFDPLDASQCQQFDISDFPAKYAEVWDTYEHKLYSRGECPSFQEFYDFQAAANPEHNTDGNDPAAPYAIPPNYSERDTPPVSPSTWARPAATVAVPQPQEKIYRNSRDFRFLEYKGLLTPGGKYYNMDSNGACSWGWTVYNKNQPERLFNLSAGHCGKAGEKVAIQASGKQPVVVGEFVDSWYDDSLKAEDYSLIEIYPEYHTYVGGTPQVTNKKTGAVTLAGWRGKTWLEKHHPYICRLGWRSGLACGSFRTMQGDMTMRFSSIQDNGDSGGPIWAYDPENEGQIYAVAVLSFDSDEDATNSGGKILEPYMSRWNLSIMR